MLIAGPTSGYLSDRYGARPFATGGMIAAACGFGLLMLLPVDFAFPMFAAILFLIGVSMGMFASPNRAAVMNSLPAADRGAGGGMNQTFQNSAQVISIGIFFTLMVIGLASTLPSSLQHGLEAHGVAAGAAHHAGQTPPISVLFAAFLGYNPIEHLVGSGALQAAGPHAQAILTGQSFFPHLIAGPFSKGLDTAFLFAIVACLIAAAASLLRGGQYHHADEPAASEGGRERQPRASQVPQPRLEGQRAR
jgi:MFS family permease